MTVIAALEAAPAMRMRSEGLDEGIPCEPDEAHRGDSSRLLQGGTSAAIGPGYEGGQGAWRQNPELELIRARLADLAEELTDHLAEEEVVVFPMIVKLEAKKARAGVEAADSCISVGNPLALLIQEHDDAGVLLAEIRSLSRDFNAPAYACTTYHAFFEGTERFRARSAQACPSRKQYSLSTCD